MKSILTILIVTLAIYVPTKLTKLTKFPSEISLQKPESAKQIPGDKLEILKFDTLGISNVKPPSLNDICSHLQQKDLAVYTKFASITTSVHEGTHGINAYLRNNKAKPGQQALYLLNNQYVILDQPKLKLSDIAAVIPESLRGSRYKLYFVDQQRFWQSMSLYVFDEGTAYINETVTAIELKDQKIEAQDYGIGAIEFVNYYIGATLAIEKHDPDYLKTNTQYKEFLAHEIRRGIKLYREANKLYPWKNDFQEKMLICKEYKDILKKLYGDSLTLEDLFK